MICCRRELNVQRKVENWSNQVIAHHTIIGDFNTFYKENVVSLDEIERMINEMNESLHVFTIPLLNQWLMVRDLGQYARAGVDQFVTSMEKDAARQDTPNP